MVEGGRRSTANLKIAVDVDPYSKSMGFPLIPSRCYSTQEFPLVLYRLAIIVHHGLTGYRLVQLSSPCVAVRIITVRRRRDVQVLHVSQVHFRNRKT